MITISLHWTTVLAALPFICGCAALWKDSRSCGEYGLPGNGLMYLFLGLIAALSILLTHARGWA